jgi:hypothetical protein
VLSVKALLRGQKFQIFRTLFKDQSALRFIQQTPCASRDIGEFKMTDAHSNEAKCRVTYRGSHAADLAVFALDQFQSEPAGWNCFAKANWRIAGWHVRLRIEKPRAASARFAALDDRAGFEFAQGFRGRNPFDLDPILALVRVTRVQQLLVEIWFITEEQETFRVGVETTNGIDFCRKPEFCQSTIGRAVGCKLGEDAIRFVERNKHRDILRQLNRRDAKDAEKRRGNAK